MKSILVSVLCFMFIGIGSALAQTELPKHSWELGSEISYIKYKEPGMMEEKGVMYGVVGSYAYRTKWMLKADGKFSYGKLDYRGQLQDGTPYSIDNIRDYMLEFRGVGGYDFPIFTSTIITPYAGMGYRYLNDDSSFDPAGYQRESNYLYSPVGVEVLTKLNNGWFWGITAEYDIFWWGEQVSHLGDAVLGANTIRNTQRKGYGLRGSVKLLTKGDRLDFVLEPFIRYWNIRKSDDADITYYGTTVGYGYEPKNNSTEIGCKLALRF
jgi:hypothetical protein